MVVVNCEQLVLISVCHVTCNTTLQGCFTVNGCKKITLAQMSSPIKDHLHFSPFTIAFVCQGMAGQSVKKVKRAKLANRKSRGGGYFLVKDYWGCAAGWGRIFTTRLTIMGLHF